MGELEIASQPLHTRIFRGIILAPTLLSYFSTAEPVSQCGERLTDICPKFRSSTANANARHRLRFSCCNGAASALPNRVRNQLSFAIELAEAGVPVPRLIETDVRTLRTGARALHEASRAALHS